MCLGFRRPAMGCAALYLSLVSAAVWGNTERGEQLPLAVSPESIKQLESADMPYLLLDVADPETEQLSKNLGPALRPVYYAVNLSNRQAKLAASKLRKKINPNAQWLAGTPLEWQRLGLKFRRDPVPSQPASVTPKALGEAIKDGVDLQVIDLRPAHIAQGAPFPDAEAIMPHQLETILREASKRRWVVLVDEGGRIANNVAETLFEKGYRLVGVLDSGYPA